MQTVPPPDDNPPAPVPYFARPTRTWAEMQPSIRAELARRGIAA